ARPKPRPKDVIKVDDPRKDVAPKDRGKDADERPFVEVVHELPGPQTPDEIKEAALIEAIDLLVDKKYEEARAALRKAQKALLDAAEKDKAAAAALDVIDREIARVPAAIHPP